MSVSTEGWTSTTENTVQGCLSHYMTVDWVAYRSAWVRGGYAGPPFSPSLVPLAQAER